MLENRSLSFIILVSALFLFIGRYSCAKRPIRNSVMVFFDPKYVKERINSLDTARELIKTLITERYKNCDSLCEIQLAVVMPSMTIGHLREVNSIRVIWRKILRLNRDTIKLDFQKIKKFYEDEYSKLQIEPLGWENSEIFYNFLKGTSWLGDTVMAVFFLTNKIFESINWGEVRNFVKTNANVDFIFVTPQRPSNEEVVKFFERKEKLRPRVYFINFSDGKSEILVNRLPIKVISSRGKEITDNLYWAPLDIMLYSSLTDSGEFWFIYDITEIYTKILYRIAEKTILDYIYNSYIFVNSDSLRFKRFFFGKGIKPLKDEWGKMVSMGEITSNKFWNSVHKWEWAQEKNKLLDINNAFNDSSLFSAFFDSMSIFLNTIFDTIEQIKTLHIWIVTDALAEDPLEQIYNSAEKFREKAKSMDVYLFFLLPDSVVLSKENPDSLAVTVETIDTIINAFSKRNVFISIYPTEY